MSYLLEYNIEAYDKIAHNGYKEHLKKEFGIDCGVVENLDKYLLEIDYRLDKSIC